MFNKIQTLFPNAIIQKQHPGNTYYDYEWFTNEEKHWLGIPHDDISEDQFQLLSALFHHQPMEKNIPTSPTAQKWNLFLFEDGAIPARELSLQFRLIHFHWAKTSVNPFDLEAAFGAFFNDKLTIVWENESRGLIVEQKTSHSLSEEDFLAMLETVKTDFFIEPYVYIGKFRPLSDSFISAFQNERLLFDFAIRGSKQERIFQFEKITPLFVTHELSKTIKDIMIQDILPIFEEDFELFKTIKIFLQNNLNASITAKQLFIHRNTLQYRIDKFVDRTGITLKDFTAALTVYSACLLFESRRGQFA